MLVASVTFYLTHIFTLVLASQIYQKASIEKTTVSTVYNNGEKVQSGDNYILPWIAEITWKQAENSCFNQKAKILTMEKNMDMRKIMTDLEMITVLVGIYKSLTMDVFIDYEDKSLITITDNETINHSALNALTFVETQAIILRKTDTELRYETVPKTEQHVAFVCKKSPFREKNQTFLG
jgi:hypothetical protein